MVRWFGSLVLSGFLGCFKLLAVFFFGKFSLLSVFCFRLFCFLLSDVGRCCHLVLGFVMLCKLHTLFRLWFSS